MPRPSKAERLADIHEEALIEFGEIFSACSDEREQCLQDRRFYSISGAQWEGELKDQFENKPRFEVNKVHLAVIRIISEYRNSRISVDFKPKNGNKDESFADTCNGMYRADENDSKAEEAYDNAFEEGTSGGIGAWRLRAKYEDEEDEEDDLQRIWMEPIFDADSSVFFDLNAKLQDKSDATKCYVLTSMTRASYEDEYDDDVSSWPKETNSHGFDWHTPEAVYVAEYYVIENKKKTIHVWQYIDGREERYTDEELEVEYHRLRAIGAKEVRTKKINTKRVHKYILSGSKILEDCGYIAGNCIPIIMFYGKYWVVDNVERAMGHVRLAKDAQRLKNMQLSKLGEISAVSGVAKPILTPEQVVGHKLMWEEDNVKNYPYLLINSIMDANGNEMPSGPIGYTKAPEIPQALAALLQLTEEDISDLLGNQQNGEQLQGNISTDTAHLVQNRLDMQTFIYMSNFAKAMRRSGEVWLSMAKDVYVEEDREMESASEVGETSVVQLMKPIVDSKTGETVYTNDFSKAKMKVVTAVGPSSSTRKLATTRALTNMLAQVTDPETQQIISWMILMNTEGEGIEDLRAHFRKKLLRLGAAKPTEEEKEELEAEAANQPPNAQDEYLKAAASKEQTEAVKNQVETIREQAEADKTRAETQEILSKLNLDKLKAIVEAVEKLGPRVIPGNIEGSTIQG